MQALLQSPPFQYAILLVRIAHLLLAAVIISESPRTGFAEESGLLAYWSFDENDASMVKDYSGNEFHLSSSRIVRTQGIIANALACENNRSLVLTEGFEDFFVFPGDYTVEIWVKHHERSPQIYISKWTGAGNGSAWWMGYYEGCLQWAEYAAQTQLRLKGPDIADGRWHYVVGTRSGNRVSLYLDGQLIGQRVCPQQPAGDNPAPVRIGGYGAGRYPSWPFQGAIDEVRIYTRTLTAAEIAERFGFISGGKKAPTSQAVAQGLPSRVVTRLFMPAIVPSGDHPRATLALLTNRSFSGQPLTTFFRIRDTGGKSVREWQVPMQPSPGTRRQSKEIALPALAEGEYELEVSIGSEGQIRKRFQVQDLRPVIIDNLKIKADRATKNRFYRGIVSAYAGLRYKRDGAPDVDATLAHLQRLGVNVYTYLIASRSAQELAALAEFCQKAEKIGIEVWVYLVPPSEAPVNRDRPISERRYPPFDMDYLKWSEAVARTSLDHPNLTLWMIDDFDGNLRFFTLDYTRQIYEQSKSINPRLLFGVCVYHESLPSFIKAGYLDYVDALLWGYQHSSARYPECGLDATTLPIEINDYLHTGKIAIPCIYFTPHSSWPEGRPTRSYLERAMATAFEQAGIVWVFTTPGPNTMQEEVVRTFTAHHPLPKWHP